MSGNPFRKSKLPSDNSSIGAAAASVETSTTSSSDSKRTKKRVQIQTPPDSPELTYTPEDNGRRLSASDSAGRAGSPPPPTPTHDDEDEKAETFTTADQDLREALRNTRQNSGSLAPGPSGSAGAMRAPFNPFSRTSLSKDGNQNKQLGRQDEPRAGGGRPALDVDAFKNILLTGSATPSPPSGHASTGASSSVRPRAPVDSGSSTDTSSLFDPGYSLQAESPRTSFDDYDDASDSGNDEDEKSGLMGHGRLDDLAPPAPPKPKTRGPQTVSFADFDQSIPPGFQAPSSRTTTPVNVHLHGILRSSSPRSLSDLNKPLPAPPQGSTEPPPPPFVPDKDSLLSEQPRPTDAIAAGQQSAKKVPPPPPTRRKAGETARPRSSSNLSNDTQGSSPFAMPSEVEQSSAAQEPPNKLAPPPPPMRKTQVAPNVPARASKDSSPSNSTTEVPKAVPPPPPRRNPSKTGGGETLSRQASDANSKPQKPGDVFLAVAAPANNPPAPPPRRLGGSKRSSMEGTRPDTIARRLSGIEHPRRSSGNSFDSERSTSVSSLQQVREGDVAAQDAVASPGEESRRDVLADMAAFQAEIDAMRAQHQRPR